MSLSLREISASLLLVAALVPGAAMSQSTSSSTSSGVQIIDMNPQPSTHKAAAPKSSPPAPELPGAALLVHNAMAYVGTPYKKNGLSQAAGFDSAGLTTFAFASIGLSIPRTAQAQFYAGRPIAGDPLPGDLVFFQTTAIGPSDVGIYLGDGKFLLSTAPNVHVDSFQSEYFKSRYLGARRFL